MKRPFALAALWLLVSSLVFGSVGKESKGGDPLASEFVARAYILLGKFRRLEGRDRPLTDNELDQFENAVKNTRVELVTEELTDPQGGGAVTSVVEPDPLKPGTKRIRIHRGWWAEALYKKLDVDKFVCHEYLRVIGKEDSQYQTSVQLLRLAETSGQGDFKSVELRFRIAGEIVPTPKPVCYSIDIPTSTKEAANDKYNLKFLSAVTDIKTHIFEGLGPKVRLVNFKTKANDADKSASYSNGIREYHPGEYIGYHLFSDMSAFLLIDVVPEIRKITPNTLWGEGVTYLKTPVGTTEAAVQAMNKARKNFTDACVKWRAKVLKQLEDRLVYANCGIPYLRRFPVQTKDTISAYYSGEPEIFFLAE